MCEWVGKAAGKAAHRFLASACQPGQAWGQEPGPGLWPLLSTALNTMLQSQALCLFWAVVWQLYFYAFLAPQKQSSLNASPWITQDQVQREIIGRVVRERLLRKRDGKTKLGAAESGHTTFCIDQPEFPRGILCPFPAVSFPGGF